MCQGTSRSHRWLCVAALCGLWHIARGRATSLPGTPVWFLLFTHWEVIMLSPNLSLGMKGLRCSSWPWKESSFMTFAVFKSVQLWTERRKANYWSLTLMETDNPKCAWLHGSLLINPKLVRFLSLQIIWFWIASSEPPTLLKLTLKRGAFFCAMFTWHWEPWWPHRHPFA